MPPLSETGPMAKFTSIAAKVARDEQQRGDAPHIFRGRLHGHCVDRGWVDRPLEEPDEPHQDERQRRVF